MSQTVRRARPRVAVLAAVAAAALAVSATPAAASSMFFSKSSGTVARAEWYEVGELPDPVVGNAHLGFLNVEDLGRGRANVFGYVDCDPGEFPGGGGHGGEVPDGQCDYLDTRFIEGGSVTFTIDRKLNSATLTGTLNVFGHAGPMGSPPVNMTWTGVGGLTKTTSTYTSKDEFGTYTYRSTESGRVAQPSGNIGVMVFDDEEGEYSIGFIGSYRNSDRGRTP